MRATVVILFAVALAMFGLSSGALAQDEVPVATAMPGNGCDPATDPLCTPDTFDWTCADFPTQADAQALYDAGGYVDIEKIDPDYNGFACDHEGWWPTPPTPEPTPEPTEQPYPTEEPTPYPTAEATPIPTEVATVEATETPMPEPTDVPTGEPTVEPTSTPVPNATAEPTTVDVATTEPGTDDGGASVELEAGPTDVLAEAPATTDADDSDDAGGNGSVTLPRTGIGVASTDALGWFISLVAGLAVAFGGAAYGLRRRRA